MVGGPSTIDEVDAAWLSGELGAPVDGVDAEVIGAGEGFMGRLARLRLTSSDPAVPATAVLKLPTDDPGGRMIGEMMRVWEREHRFYAEVAPHVDIRVPKALVNIADPACLVLEDLAPATPGDHVAGATLDQAERAVDVLARHHATWFEHPRLASFDWMPGLDDPQVLTIPDTFAMGWPMFLERFGDDLAPRTLRWCERFVADVPGWLSTHLDDPITLTHGDFRLDNLFFDDASAGTTGADSVAVIDWQMAMKVPGQADFVYFCANNLTTEMRRERERGLLDRYVDGLHAAGVPDDVITVDSVWQGYLEGLVFYAVSFGASLLTIDPANERGVRLFEALVHRTFTAVDDLDAGVALGFPSAG